jgi:hypothetical protein
LGSDEVNITATFKFPCGQGTGCALLIMDHGKCDMKVQHWTSAKDFETRTTLDMGSSGDIFKGSSLERSEKESAAVALSLLQMTATSGGAEAVIAAGRRMVRACSNKLQFPFSGTAADRRHLRVRLPQGVLGGSGAEEQGEGTELLFAPRR